jgi:hypothetical protein
MGHVPLSKLQPMSGFYTKVSVIKWFIELGVSNPFELFSDLPALPAKGFYKCILLFG